MHSHNVSVPRLNISRMTYSATPWPGGNLLWLLLNGYRGRTHSSSASVSAPRRWNHVRMSPIHSLSVLSISTSPICIVASGHFRYSCHSIAMTMATGGTSSLQLELESCLYSLLCMVSSKYCYHSNKLTVPSVYWIGGIYHFVSLFLLLLSVSEAPRAAPAAKKFPSYNPQYKTDEEKKEEVRDVIESLQFLSRPCNSSMFATPQWLHITCPSSLVGSNFWSSKVMELGKTPLLTYKITRAWTTRESP